MAGNPWSGGQGGGGMQGASAGSFQGDPALIQAQANINQSLAFAEQEAMREMRQLLIDYGDPALAAKYLGEPNTEQDMWQLNNPTLGSGDKSGGRFPNSTAYMNALQKHANPMPQGGAPIVKNQWGSYDWDPSGPQAGRGGGTGRLTPQQEQAAARARADIAGIQAGQRGTFYTSEAEAQAALARMGAPQIQGYGGAYTWMSPQKDVSGQGWNIKKVHQGKGIDVQAAEGNPYSVLKRLSRQAEGDQYDANENLNKANLWYSSERGRVLGELGNDAQSRSYDAARAVQDQLSAIQSQLQQSQIEAQQQLAAQTLASQQAQNNKIKSAAGGR